MSKYIGTIGVDDFGPALGVKLFRLRGAIGRIQPNDSGKRVYEVTSPSGYVFYQVENNEQRDLRNKAALSVLR